MSDLQSKERDSLPRSLWALIVFDMILTLFTAYARFHHYIRGPQRFLDFVGMLSMIGILSMATAGLRARLREARIVWICIAIALLLGSLILASTIPFIPNEPAIATSASSFTLFDIRLHPRNWALLWSCTLFVVGALHLLILTRPVVRNCFHRRLGTPA